MVATQHSQTGHPPLTDRGPVIETARLRLRLPELSDFDSFAAFFSDDRSKIVGGPLNRQASWGAFASGSGQWLLRGYGFWEVIDRETGVNIGRAGIYHPDFWPEPELGWIIYGNDHEGRGLAHEAAIAARDGAARHFGITRPISSIKATNTRSIKLAERMGARRDGTWETPYGPMLRFRHDLQRAA